MAATAVGGGRSSRLGAGDCVTPGGSRPRRCRRAGHLGGSARLLFPGQGRKTDVNDAATVALVAQHHRRLRRVQAEDLGSVIRLVSHHRDDVVAEHTSGVNRLHRLLRDLIPGGAKTGLSTRQAADLLRRVRPVTATETARKQFARDLIVGLRALEARTKTLTDQLVA